MDLESQKAIDPVPNATVADDPDESRQSSSHAVPVSPASVASSHQMDAAFGKELNDDWDEMRNILGYRNLDGILTVNFFQYLHEINIIKLEAELAETHIEAYKAASSAIGKEVLMTRLEDQLHRYSKTHGRGTLDDELTLAFNTATAIQDYEYMKNLHDIAFTFQDYIMMRKGPPPRWETAFQMALGLKTLPRRANSSSDPLRRWLGRILPHSLRWTEEEANVRDNHYSNRKITPEIVSPFVDRLARFIVAMTGGLSLVVPMLIMSIPQGSTRSLVTTSVAVVFFAGVISVGFNASNGETLGITAAYAAVLVVFVGTSVQQASTPV